MGSLYGVNTRGAIWSVFGLVRVCVGTGLWVSGRGGRLCVEGGETMEFQWDLLGTSDRKFTCEVLLLAPRGPVRSNQVVVLWEWVSRGLGAGHTHGKWNVLMQKSGTKPMAGPLRYLAVLH